MNINVANKEFCLALRTGTMMAKLEKIYRKKNRTLRTIVAYWPWAIFWSAVFILVIQILR
jgi:hypothetical protein